MRRSGNAAEGLAQTMPIEIEKKYRLTLKDRRAIEKRLRAHGSQPKPLEHEENTIYRGGVLDFECSRRICADRSHAPNVQTERNEEVIHRLHRLHR